METEPTKTTPILEIAWTRFAHLSASARKGKSLHYQVRRWIIILGVLATLFAIFSLLFPRENSGLVGLIIRILLVAAPIAASALAAFAMKRFSNGDWLILRAGAEEILKEIYFYRTVLQKNTSRRSYLEKRINEIQRQVFRGLGGEFSFEPYNGNLPPNYSPQNPRSDPGFNDITGEDYVKYRLEDQLDWHNKKINEYKKERDRLQWFVIGFGAVGALLAAFDESTIWVALAASITAAYVSWQELRNLDAIIKNYSKVVMELTILYDHWHNLEVEERTSAEFYKMVRGCEEVLWAQNTEYIKSMQETLKDADLEEEASLVNRVIKESMASDARMKQAMRDSVVETTRGAFEHAEGIVEEEFNAAIGSLAEEASSELVQQELAAMREAAVEFAENVAEKASNLTSSLADIAKEFAHIDIGRDTTKEELNAILARYPKTNDVKG